MEPIDGTRLRALMGQLRTREPERPGIPLSGQEGGASFGDLLERALADVNELQVEARTAIDSFLRGEAVEVHEVMAAAEEAGIALEMLIEFRNKSTEAYRTVINMQN